MPASYVKFDDYVTPDEPTGQPDQAADRPTAGAAAAASSGGVPGEEGLASDVTRGDTVSERKTARVLHGFYSQPAAHDVRGHPWCQFADFQRPLMYWPSLLRPPAGHALRPLPAALDARLEGSQLLFATRENNRRVLKLQ